MRTGLVTIFGGSGFVGKHVVRALVKDGWRVRVAVRRPHTANDLRVIGNVGQVHLVQANIRFKTSVERAVEGSDAVINLVSVLFEDGKQNFNSLHVLGARVVADAAKVAGISNVIQVSAIGADKDAPSAYSRTKAAGEAIVRELIPTADIMRPSIIFGPEDSFFNRFAAMTNISPFIPLIGGGDTKFQPVYVGDVAQAIAQRLKQGTSGEIYELGGPRIYSFKEMMEFMLTVVNRKRLLLPLPWAAASMMGFTGEMIGKAPLIKPFLTRDQVNSFRTDNIVSESAKGFKDLDIELETIESMVPPYLERYRKYGQFHEREA